jgi:hypothetical protein
MLTALAKVIPDTLEANHLKSLPVSIMADNYLMLTYLPRYQSLDYQARHSQGTIIPLVDRIV